MAERGRLPLLHRLPEELLQSVLKYLDRGSLKCLNEVSRWSHEKASPHIWNEVSLIDCQRHHSECSDAHDDTPLIKKLLVLATNPWLAAFVQTVNHRCNLPPPAIFRELPCLTFTGQTLSSDPRTICLVRLAVKNMCNVHTLRIIFGHAKLTEALIRCFFDRDRAKNVHVRRLWLESCRVTEATELHIDRHKYQLPLHLDFQGLESLRLRRMPMYSLVSAHEAAEFEDIVYSRLDTTGPQLQNGFGGIYETYMSTVHAEWAFGVDHLRAEMEGPERQIQEQTPLECLFGESNVFDDEIYDAITAQFELPQEVVEASIESHAKRSVMAYQVEWTSRMDTVPFESSSLFGQLFRKDTPSAGKAVADMLQCASPTLTSLNFDWVTMGPYRSIHQQLKQKEDEWTGKWFTTFFHLRFPNLRALQFRNTMVPEARLPNGLYLLSNFSRQTTGTQTNGKEAVIDWAALDFLKAHPKLQCLAWPMDRFFPADYRHDNARGESGQVIENLGRTLMDLRVDTTYNRHGELHSEEYHMEDIISRTSRRSFISDFTAHMTKIESIKIEGGMPLDERREVLRALHACPLQKIVSIGVNSPLGNTWGLSGQDMGEPISPHDMDRLEAEDKLAIWALGPRPPTPPNEDFRFTPSYGWAGAAPMMHTIASYHGSTLREVKFCGYKGSPVLLSPTAITVPMLSALKHLHKVESVILSLWLSTMFEGQKRDSEVIDYWVSAREASSTALVLIRDEEPEEGSWDHELRTKYAPDAVAWRVTNFVGPYLSETAKSRPGGVHVRGSFAIGEYGGIFDIDLYIGKGALKSDICLSYEGPREELETGRRRAKLESRRWF